MNRARVVPWVAGLAAALVAAVLAVPAAGSVGATSWGGPDLEGTAASGDACRPVSGADDGGVALGELVTSQGEPRDGLDNAEQRLVARAEAAVEQMSEERALADVAGDASVHVDVCGELFYVEPVTVEEQVDFSGAATAELQSATTSIGAENEQSDVFALNSRPGANFTIFIDFAARTLPATNQWARTYNSGRSLTKAAWSLDADPAFNAEERATIHALWRETADAYAPFDVNVTTQRPADDRLGRSSLSDTVHGVTALVGTIPAIERGCGGCLGVAYLDMTDRIGAARESVQPALAFVPDSATIIHEVGHNLGLQHHGDLTPSGRLASEYHSGDAAWEPIMGSGAGEFRQWSSGDYPDASRPFQDDLAVLSRRFPLLADDHGDTTATATVYGAAGSPSREGRIERPGDADRFTFTTDGPTDIAVEFAEKTGLRAEVTLLNATGTLLHRLDTVTPSLTQAWQQAGQRLALAPGTYQVRVRGVSLVAGRDARDVPYAARGAYGSLGAYRLKVSPDTTRDALTVTQRRSSVLFNSGVEHQFVVGVPTGGIGPYTVTCDAPETLVVCGGASGGVFKPQAPGTHAIGWTVRDGRGEQVSGVVNVTVRQRPLAEITGVQTAVQVGGSVAWLIKRTGPSISLGVRAFGVPRGLTWSSSQGGYVGSPTAPGVHRVELQAFATTTWPEEVRGLGASTAFLLTVNPVGGLYTPPAAPTPTATPTATSTPTPTATSTPTTTPTSTPTTEPSASPSASPSVRPSVSPSASPSASATPSPPAPSSPAPQPAVKVKKPVFLTKATLPRARVGKKYRAVVKVRSTAKVSWWIVGKTLPRGLKARVVLAGNRTKVVISGTPRASGRSTVKLRSRNSAGTATKTFSVRVVRR